MSKKTTKVMFKNFIRDHEIRIDDEVTKCVQEYIYLERKLVHVQTMKKRSQKKNRDGMKCI